MAHQIRWTARVLENFIQKGLLNKDEEFIMRTRVMGWTITQQSMELHKSVSTINNIIKDLKLRYDAVQREFPEEFPVRKGSKEEEYMDTH